MVTLRWFLCLPWFLFTVWMFIYSMPLSGIYSLMLLWVLMPLERQETSWFTILFAPIFIWNVGFIEYGLKTIDLHCRVLGYSGTKSPPTFCSFRPESFQKGRNHTEGALFTKSEQMGVHGFNVLLATGGLMTGLKEVAWETAYMSFVADPSDKGMVNERKSVRLKQCDGGKSAQKKEISEGRGAFLLDSSTIRKLIAKNVRTGSKVKDGNPKTFRPQNVVFKASTTSVGNDNSYYGALMKRDNFKAPITLVVPDGKLHMEALHNGTEPIFDVQWKGTISYPPNALFVFPIPTIWQLSFLQSHTNMQSEFPLLLSEGIFCGMQIDGAMNPYTQVWKTKVPVSDPRFSDAGKKESVHGPIEFLLDFVL
jgi:hypothetical protein